MVITRRARRALVAAGSAAAVVLSFPAIAGAEQHNAADAPVLRLRTGEVTLVASDSPSFARAPRLPHGRRGLFVAQFDGPVGAAQRLFLEGHGAAIDGYLPDFAYLVRMTAAQADAVAGGAGVRAVERFTPEWKRSAAATDSARLYTVTVAGDADVAAVRAAAASSGAVASVSGRALLIAATGAQVDTLSRREDVTSVDAYTMMRPLNESAVFTTMKGQPAADRGYDGSSQIAAVADTGFGTGVAATAHPGVPGSRITAIRDWPTADIANCRVADPDGPRDVDSGHGTHTATSVVGGGDATGVGKAAAYQARLVFQAVQDWVKPIGSCGNAFKEGYHLGGLPTDIRTLFAQAYADGARVHSNSWGGPRNGVYEDNAAGVDDFIARNRDMTITFAAGNGGGDTDRNGVVDPDSVGAPATAKNGIAVGASESGRRTYACDRSLTYSGQTASEKRSWGADGSCQKLGGTMPLPTWGAWYPSMAPVAPLKDDPQAGNDQQMTPFSGRGPTDDGRIKPDLVAPGAWILSGYSPLFRQGYDSAMNPKNKAYQSDAVGFPYDGAYKYNTGTSMSNPLVAGGAVVVRDYYVKKHGQNASAALVKATLVNGATDLLDEDSDGRDDNRHPIPNIHEGWGLANLDRATAGTAIWLDEGAALDTGATREYQVTAKAGAPMKITLAWTDPAAKVNAATTLVNDLDLEVSGPGGVRLGNVFSGGWSTTGGSADRRNNLENVFLQAPAAGTYTVRVRGANVPTGPQTYALVMDGVTAAAGGINRNPQIAPQPDHRSTLGAPVNLQLKATDPDGDPVTVTATGLPDGLSVGATNGLISGSPVKGGRFTVRVTADDGRGGAAAMAFRWDVEPNTTGNLVANPGFEQGAGGWTGDTGVIVSGVNPPPRGGDRYARFTEAKNARQQLSTTVAVPAGATNPKVFFWVHVATHEMSSFDRDTLTLDGNGTKLAQVSNVQAAPDWQLVSADLSAFKGRSVTLKWTMKLDNAMPTTFTLDDVAVVAQGS
ncbi:S8 family serine peptidase [Pilimelia columellifera]|uniref:Peptidase S8/S53 domain-containing protein n=1 Tax=Pilimelia columellifera subsp. columellifera TaxID=706583 RepID=A0ABN3N5Q8_9ACTN